MKTPVCVVEVVRDRVGGGESLVQVERLARVVEEREAVPDHVAVDRREETVGKLAAANAVVEDVGRVERDLRVEEVLAYGCVALASHVEVRCGPGVLVEQQRRLDRVPVGLERLQVVAAAVWLLIADRRTRAESEHGRSFDELEGRLGLREHRRIVRRLVLSGEGDRVPLGNVAPGRAARSAARRRVARSGGGERGEDRGQARIAGRLLAQGKRVGEGVGPPVLVGRAARAGRAHLP